MTAKPALWTPSEAVPGRQWEVTRGDTIREGDSVRRSPDGPVVEVTVIHRQGDRMALLGRREGAGYDELHVAADHMVERLVRP